SVGSPVINRGHAPVPVRRGPFGRQTQDHPLAWVQVDRLGEGFAVDVADHPGIVPPRLAPSLGRSAGLHGATPTPSPTGWHYSILCQLSRTSFASRFCRSVPFGTIRT